MTPILAIAIPWPSIVTMGLGLLIQGVLVGLWAGRIGGRLDAQAVQLETINKGLDDRIDLKILRCRQSPPACPVPTAPGGPTDTAPRGVPVLDGG